MPRVLRCNRIPVSPLRLLRLASLASALAWFSDVAAYGVVSVNQPWTKPGVRASEAYMIVTSSESATLIGARSPVAGRVELKSASRLASALALPAGTPVILRPKGNHLALSRLTRALKLGDRVSLVLIIETATGTRQEIVVDAEVRRESPADAELRAHRH